MVKKANAKKADNSKPAAKKQAKKPIKKDAKPESRVVANE